MMPLDFRLLGRCLLAAIIFICPVLAQDVMVFPPVLRTADGSLKTLTPPAKAWKVRYPKERSRENEIGSGFLVAYIGENGLEVEMGRGAERAYAQAVHYADEGLRRLELKWDMPEHGFIWRTAIFNPPTARVDGPEAAPRLLSLEPVFLTNAEMAAGQFDLTRRFRMAKIAVGVDGAVTKVTMLGDKRLSGTGHHKRDREPMVLPDAVREKIDAVVRRWKFAPARKAGQPVEADVFVKVPIWLDPHEVFTREEVHLEIETESRFTKYNPERVQKRNFLHGRAEIEFIVDAEGKVRVPRVLSETHDDLGRLAVIVSRNWKFALVKRDGAPASVKLCRTVRFGSEKGEFLVPADFWDDVVPPRRESPWKMEFPEGMLGSIHGADVMAEVTIDEEGRPRSPVILQSTHPLYNQAMIDGILQTSFRPGLRDGRPAAIKTLARVRFAAGNGDRDLLEFDSPKKKAEGNVPAHLRFEQPPKSINVVIPVHPYALLQKGVEGSAELLAMIDDQGRVVATHVVSCTHAEFGQALAAACEWYVFKPGLRNGRPASGLVQLGHQFTLPVGHAGLGLARMEKRGGKAIVDGGALDHPLKVISRVAPMHPLSLLKRKEPGRAVVEALIDEEGRVQVPRVVSADEEAFGFSAMQAIAQWRFEPPMKDGQPAIVRVRLPFQFAPLVTE